ncbi:MAG: transposase [Ktedonobacteraceae bacterium]
MRCYTIKENVPSEADWDERKMQESRLQLLREDPTTAPTSKGVLVIDEIGDRKDGYKTAHVGRQYLGKLGKVDNGVVSVTSLWADEEVYYPVDFELYTPAQLQPIVVPELTPLLSPAMPALAANHLQ